MSLPIVLVCENNGYGEYTAFEDVTAGAIRARAEVMEVTAETIDGMSVWETRAAAQRAVEQARSGGGPVFVEAITYRFVGHSRSDPGKYRQARRARALARARPAARAARARSRPRASRPPRSTSSTPSVAGRAHRRPRTRGLAAPFPEPRTFSEFKERA